MNRGLFTPDVTGQTGGQAGLTGQDSEPHARPPTTDQMVGAQVLQRLQAQWVASTSLSTTLMARPARLAPRR